MANESPTDPPIFGTETHPTIPQTIDYLVEALTDPEKLERIEQMLAKAAARGGSAAGAVAVKTLQPVIEIFAVPTMTLILKTLLGVIQSVEPLTDEIGKIGIEAVLGSRPKRGFIPDNVGTLILEKLSPEGGEVTPGIGPAAQFVSTFVNLQMETWLIGVVTELFDEALHELRGAGGTLHSVAELREVVTQTFGGGRIMRRVLAPFIDAGIVAPAKWETNKRYRPELLGTGDAVRHFLRGRWTADQLHEELARQGWSDDRIEALISNATKRLTIDQLLFQFHRGAISDLQLQLAARDLGYDGDTATQLISIEDSQRIERAQAPIIDAAIAAFVAGDIDEQQLSSWITPIAPTQADGVYAISEARARRQLKQQRLSSTEVRRLAVKGVLAVSDYRRALQRENLHPDDVAALELELRIDLDAAGDKAKAKADQDAERAADAAAAAADKAKREAEIAARKALPTLQEYRRAFVRGLITRDVFSAALQREKVAIASGDLAFLLADADADREKFLSDEEKRKAAIDAVPASRLSIAQLEQSVIANITSLGDFDARLAQNGVTDEDRRILVALLQGKIEDRTEAQAQRAAAEARGAQSAVSLSKFETAVRLGVRTLDDYAAWLATIGTPEIATALILDLLRKQMADDAAAREARDTRDPEAAKGGISLAQRRRAYIAGVTSRDAYAAALAAAGWPVEDRDLELALTDAEAEAAAAARERRQQIEDSTIGESITLGQMERAVKLNLMTPDDLRDYLSARGYGPDDVELIVSLVVASIPDVRKGQELEDKVTDALAAEGISLADRKALVRRGLWTIDGYRDALRRDGFGQDDAELLTQLLSEEIALDFAGIRAKVEKALAAADGAPTLDVIVAAFDAGEIDADGVRDALLMFKVPHDSAMVFARLLPTFGNQE